MTKQFNSLTNIKVNPSFTLQHQSKQNIKRDISKLNFYHHANIFKIRDFQVLKKEEVLQNIKEAASDKQRMLLIKQFNMKVSQFLLSENYHKERARRDFKRFYERKFKSRVLYPDATNQNSFLSYTRELEMSTVKHDQTQFISNINKNLYSFETNEHADTKSCLPEFSLNLYFTEKDKCISKKFEHRQLQEYVLKKFQPFLSNDRLDYDQKLSKVTEEYQKLISLIEEKSFKIKIPVYFTPLL